MIALLAIIMAFVFVGVAIIAFIASHYEGDDDKAQESKVPARHN